MMKKKLWRILSLALVVLLMGSVVSASAAAAGASPRLYLHAVPAFGDEKGYFAGVVCGEDGGRITDPESYVIHAALSLDGNQFWPKPYFDAQYSSVNRDGAFVIQTVTADSDREALFFDFYLVTKTWADAHPAPSAEEVAQAAADHISVTRTSDGQSALSPDRKTPQLTKTSFNMPQIRSDKILVDVDLHHNTAKAEPLSQEQIEEYMDSVARFAYGVRFFSSTAEENRIAIRLAKEKYDMFVVANAWISETESLSLAECDALCELCNEHLVDMAFVGSETLQRGEISVEKLIEYIDYVRARIEDKKIAVATADTIDKFYESPQLCGACDVLAVNQFSYWEGIETSKCAQHLKDSVSGLAKLYPMKEIVVSEAGFPTMGNTIGNAVPSEEGAAAFFTEVFQYAVSEQLPLFYFMAADCTYKDEAPAESHFGIMDEKLEYKTSFAQIEPFLSGAASTVAETTDGQSETVTAPAPFPAKTIAVVVLVVVLAVGLFVMAVRMRKRNEKTDTAETPVSGADKDSGQTETPYKGDKSYIFVSYAHKDADRVIPSIQVMQKDGIRIWFDKQIKVIENNWAQLIARKIADCGLFIAFISANSLKSPDCMREWQWAIKRNKARILVFLEDVTLPEGMDMMENLHHAIYLKEYPSLDALLKDLYSADEIAAFRD